MRLKSNDCDRQTIVICGNSTQIMDRIYHERNGQKTFKTILHFFKEMHPLNSSSEIYSKWYINIVWRLIVLILLRRLVVPNNIDPLYMTDKL